MSKPIVMVKRRYEGNHSAYSEDETYRPSKDRKRLTLVKHPGETYSGSIKENICGTLQIMNVQQYEGNFPSFREPTELGSFSLDSHRNYCPDKRQLKYLVMPSTISQLHMDLNLGYSKAIKKDFTRLEKIDHILKWILGNKNAMSLNYSAKDERQPQTFNVDFICFRGLLTEIVCTPYENREDWLICATKFRGTIYLCAFDTEQDIERRKNQSARDKLMSSWGYKFEQYMTSDKKGGIPDTEAPVNEREEYCCMVKGRLNNHTLLYGAEVDAVDPIHLHTNPEDSNSTKRYIELKTSREITTERQDWNFCRYKLLKWWTQSFLIGIPKVICGFRDDDGVVHSLRKFRTREIPKMAEGLWSASACLNFCDHFFSFVKKSVLKDDPNVVYKFYWKPRQDITCTELLSPSEYQILPDWYITSFTN